MAAHLDRIDSYKSSVQARRSLAVIIQASWISLILVLSLGLGLVMIRFGPDESLLAWLVFLLGVGAVLYQPRFGVYLMVSFGLVGDTVLSGWMPFVKNFSSRESIMFLNDALIINPLEAFLGLTFLSWFIHLFSSKQMRLWHGPLFWPAMLFMLFVTVGLGYGLLTRGNVTIALWEARPLFYLPAMLVLVTNLVKTRQQVSYVLWFAMSAVFIEGIFGNWFFWVNLRGNLDGVNSITEHSAAIHMNTLFVFFLGSLLYKTSYTRRWVLGFFSLVVLIPYFATQRRSAFLVLGLALILMGVILYKEHRSAFWKVVPPAVFAAVVFIGIFWNSSGPVAVPAQAVKSVIAPESTGARNQASDAYRDLENINLQFTIHQKPITGIGFGHPFYIIAPMPDISFFQWWQYFPHNSILWIWLKTGVFGFMAMLFLVGRAVALGGKVLRQAPSNDLRAAAFTAALFLVMHFAFAYADISWDNQSMLYVGTMMGLLNLMDFSFTPQHTEKDDIQKR